MKEFKCKDGFIQGPTVIAPDTCCLFCKHCDDIFWDYTNGPYLLSCEIFCIPKDCGGRGLPSEVGGPDGTCEQFESEE